MKEINFTATKEEYEIIGRIVKRAVALFAEYDVTLDSTSLMMDITATHANGCPLRLAELLEAEEIDFAHDISGITRHIDRTTGELQDCFLPRYSQPQGGVSDE